jgi:hypothetical protein
VKSRTTDEFRKSFANLPKQVQEQTREAYRQFQENPSYPSLRFKKCIQSYQFTLLESATTIEPLVSWMEILQSGFGLVHTQSTTGCYLSYNSYFIYFSLTL